MEKDEKDLRSYSFILLFTHFGLRSKCVKSKIKE